MHLSKLIKELQSFEQEGYGGIPVYIRVTPKIEHIGVLELVDTPAFPVLVLAQTTCEGR